MLLSIYLPIEGLVFENMFTKSQEVIVFIDCVGRLSVISPHRRPDGNECKADQPTLGIQFILHEDTERSYIGRCGICDSPLTAPKNKLRANG
jgi:hypothetical protein